MGWKSGLEVLPGSPLWSGCASATLAAGMVRPEPWCQLGLVPFLLHVLISPPQGQCPERWPTCSQKRGLAGWGAILGEEPQGQAPTPGAGEQGLEPEPRAETLVLIWILWL